MIEHAAHELKGFCQATKMIQLCFGRIVKILRSGRAGLDVSALHGTTFKSMELVAKDER